MTDSPDQSGKNQEATPQTDPVVDKKSSEKKPEESSTPPDDTHGVEQQGSIKNSK